ncbi:MAG: hypothetical protein KA715_03890 [Xanthomonadaceae bacterium]|nr:hypothetical protein [Xanthomonadaceae bacterium]
MPKAKKPEAKKAGKTKGSKDEPEEELTEAQMAAAGPQVDQEEAEEQAEAANFQKSSANEAEEAAGGEVSLSFKNFRHHPEMENFYRFIYENDLRYEALAIIDQVTISKGGTVPPPQAQKKPSKASKSKSH